MNKIAKKLLLRSFDTTLTESESAILEQALSQDEELNQLFTDLTCMRKTLAHLPHEAFSNVTEPVLTKIQLHQKKILEKQRAVQLVYNYGMTTAAALLIILLLVVWKGQVFNIDSMLSQPGLITEDISSLFAPH